MGAKCDRVPLVPVMLTEYLPADPVHERTDVPEDPRVTPVGLRVQISPVEGETDGISVTVPVNALIDVTVIEEAPAIPATTVTLVGLAFTEKSGTAMLYAMAALWDRVPLTPVTVTAKLPLVAAVQESVELPEPLTPVGVRAQLMPFAGLLVKLKLTTPVNPLTAVTVILDVPAWLTLTATLVGFAEIVKS